MATAFNQTLTLQPTSNTSFSKTSNSQSSLLAWSLNNPQLFCTTLFLTLVVLVVTLRLKPFKSAQGPLVKGQTTSKAVFEESNTAEVAHIRSQIQGTWRLVSYQLRAHGPITLTRYPLSQEATGIIMYTPDGFMSVQIMAPGCPAFKATNPHGGTAKENSQAASHYMAYAGKYAVGLGSDKQPLLQHSFEFSLYPNWLGTDQLRICALNGDELTLTPYELATWNGMKIEAILKWRKVIPIDKAAVESVR